MSKPILQVVIGSTRPGRAGVSIAEWFEGLALKEGSFEIDVVDLEQIALPLFDEPHHPRLRAYENEHTKRWSKTVDRADAFAFVILEYNYSLNAAVKNAIDYLFHEWQYKPLGVISYGGISGGLRAAQMLKQIGTALKMLPTPDFVTIPMIGQLHDSQGNFLRHVAQRTASPSHGHRPVPHVARGSNIAGRKALFCQGIGAVTLESMQPPPPALVSSIRDLRVRATR